MSKAIFYFRGKKEQRGRSKPAMEKQSTGLGFELYADMNPVCPSTKRKNNEIIIRLHMSWDRN